MYIFRCLQNYTYFLGEGGLLSVSKCVSLDEVYPPESNEVEEPTYEEIEAGEIYTAKMVVKVTGGW